MKTKIPTLQKIYQFDHKQDILAWFEKNPIQQYLYVEENRSGDKWIMPLSPRNTLDIKKLVSKWKKMAQVCEEDMILSFHKCPLEYSATIYTDNNHPFCGHVWDSINFVFIDKSEAFNK